MAKKKISSKKEIMNHTETPPAYIKKGSGRGNDEVTFNDITLPRISIIQDLSDQHKKTSSKYIEGAEVGMMFNTVTNELYNELYFTPFYFTKKYLVWVQRKYDSSGVLKGVFDRVEQAEEFVRNDEMSNTLEIKLTHEHLILADDGSELILSMPSTKIKVSSAFNSLIKLIGGDRFSHRYQLTVVPEAKSTLKYFNFKIQVAGYPSELVYKKAERLYEQLKAGDIKRVTDYQDNISDVDDM